MIFIWKLEMEIYWAFWAKSSQRFHYIVLVVHVHERTCLEDGIVKKMKMKVVAWVVFSMGERNNLLGE